MKHTEGVWKVLPGTYDGGRGKKIVGDNNNPHFMMASGPICDSEETIANAHLISAAPDLLEVVRHAVNTGYFSGAPDFLKTARQALVKAEGG